MKHAAGCEVCGHTIMETPDKAMIDHGDFFLCTKCDSAASHIMLDEPHAMDAARFAETEPVQG